ncbi:MAG TPA: hypothetical protein VHP13_04125 [Gammaproteobacteria bacterium]|nr:hypothetical protein [Gammaproteobacteria bacterium]
MRRRLSLPICLLLLLTAWAGAADASDAVTLGRAVVNLDGPWKFHIGDDPRWADPGFDDSAWEDMDLSAPPDANDGDVGITPYTSGWASKGHPGYDGYAWYRLRVTVTPPPGETLALLGPWDVDSSYQVYADGHLLGGVGDFSGTTPTAHGTHYPRRFELPPDLAKGGTHTLAIRVWMGPWNGNAPGVGGIHVAPAIGTSEAIDARYHMQWLKIVEGYAVDVAPATMMLLTAIMALCLWPLARADKAYTWLAAALLCSALQRGNQAFFFWFQVETIQGFVIFILGMIAPCALGAWMMAWRAWFKLDTPRWLPKAVAALAGIYALSQLARPWLFHASFASFPPPWSQALGYLRSGVHWAFLLSYVLIAYLGIRRSGREGWYALPAVLAQGVVLFSGELSLLHVPGIWFPFGVGVSLSEYAAVVACLLLSGLLLRRLWSHAGVRRTPI